MFLTLKRHQCICRQSDLLRVLKHCVAWCYCITSIARYLNKFFVQKQKSYFSNTVFCLYLKCARLYFIYFGKQCPNSPQAFVILNEFEKARGDLEKVPQFILTQGRKNKLTKACHSMRKNGHLRSRILISTVICWSQFSAGNRVNVFELTLPNETH